MTWLSRLLLPHLGRAFGWGPSEDAESALLLGGGESVGVAGPAAHHAARRAEHQRELEETADTMRELRKAIRSSRFWPSAQAARLRRLYEAQEAIVAIANPLGPPPRPSWQIADDAEFERFLQRYYVDAFLDRGSSRRAIRPESEVEC